jgi:hypothetical protein
MGRGFGRGPRRRGGGGRGRAEARLHRGVSLQRPDRGAFDSSARASAQAFARVKAFAEGVGAGDLPAGHFAAWPHAGSESAGVAVPLDDVLAAAAGACRQRGIPIALVPTARSAPRRRPRRARGSGGGGGGQAGGAGSARPGAPGAQAGRPRGAYRQHNLPIALVPTAQPAPRRRPCARMTRRRTRC